MCARSQIEVRLDLDGTGCADISTGVGFFDHMLTALAKHGHLDLRVRCKGNHHMRVACDSAEDSRLDDVHNIGLVM